MKNTKFTVGILAVILILGIAALGFAFDGYGPGYGGGMWGRGMGYGCGAGYGQGPMRGYYGSNAYGNLSQEDAAKLDQSQAKFFDETRELRSSIRDKQFALDDELQKANPDKAKIDDLQKQLSQLESQFDQKATDHQLELRKQVPQNTYGQGYGRGYGRGRYCGW